MIGPIISKPFFAFLAITSLTRQFNPSLNPQPRAHISHSTLHFPHSHQPVSDYHNTVPKIHLRWICAILDNRLWLSQVKIQALCARPSTPQNLYTTRYEDCLVTHNSGERSGPVPSSRLPGACRRAAPANTTTIIWVQENEHHQPTLNEELTAGEKNNTLSAWSFE